jgi:hypothetical protein
MVVMNENNLLVLMVIIFHDCVHDMIIIIS